MPIDLAEFGRKIQRRRTESLLSHEEVSASTGIPPTRLVSLEAGQQTPTGDEVLILADTFFCDYRFLISNEQLAASEQTESLYRRYGTEFSQSDRRAILEFLFLCECEQMLYEDLGRTPGHFAFTPRGNFLKAHGDQAALSLRNHFGYRENQVPSDVYDDFRRIGFHVFRRHLGNSAISGITIRHPLAGTCLLVNYSEDVYRQRFTADHEGAHGILDRGEDVVVTFTKASARSQDVLIETRANRFASQYLLPPSVVTAIPVDNWNEATIVHWASRFKVSTKALAIALRTASIIGDDAVTALSAMRVPASMKVDPELANLDARASERKRELLKRGLSTSYVSLCFEALSQGKISGGRAAEMMLIDDFELNEIASLFHVHLQAL